MMNKLAGQNVFIPNDLREYFARYCGTRTEGSQNTPEDSPFPRMVDFWFFGLGVSSIKGLPPTTIDLKNCYNAIPGTVFGSDSHRANTILLFCVAKTGNI